MGTLRINVKNIIGNLRKLNTYFSDQNVEWTLITKMFGGDKEVLEKILVDDSIKNIHSIGDARISNLRTIKKIKPELVTIYIKPPAVNQVPNIIKYADISMNSSYETIAELNKEAKKHGKVHRVIVMIEMGELREGILRENIIDFYQRIFDMDNISVIGLGTNLGCMYGIEPTYDKLIQLSLFRLLLEEKFKRKIELISGGSSITLSLLKQNRLPKGINHLRIGETAFFGKDLINGKQFKNLSPNTFDFSAEILELEWKSNQPDGVQSDASIGHTVDYEKLPLESWRAIVDFGVMDVDVNDLTPKDKDVKFFGTTSDMTVYTLGENKKKYKVGGKIHFNPNYMAIARLMNSRYVTREFV